MGKASPLKKYRQEQHQTLEALAEKFRVNKSTILRWERGDVPVPTDRLAEIETVTGIKREVLRPDIFGAA